MWLYMLDLIGVAVFAVSGALAGVRRGLDLFGIVVVAAVTAIGGGTARDVLLRHPVFWTKKPVYLYVILAATAIALVGQHVWSNLEVPLVIADALGLALFALSGAEVAENDRHAAIVIVVMGTMTGVAGGVMRDVLSGVVPLLLRRDIYATAAIAGISAYLLLQALGTPRRVAFLSGILCIVALRLFAVRYDWQLPVFAR